MSNELFNEQKDYSKDIETMKAEMAAMKAKQEALSAEKEAVEQSWQSEKARLEKSIAELQPWADTARNIDKLANENPEELIARVANHSLNKKKAASVPSSGSADVEARMKPLEEKLSRMEAAQEKESQERQIAEMQNAIVDSIENLKAEGVQADPKEILSFMKTRGLRDPEHVSLAANSLYANALIEAKVKAKGKVKAAEGVVMGSGGFDSSEVEDEELQDEPNTVTPRTQSRVQKTVADDRIDDKVWKTLEKSL